MVVKNKISIRLAICFFIIYTLATTLGSIFLVTWGSTNWYKEIMNFMLSWPVNWDKLIMESYGWLFVNICFWTAAVYLASLFLENLVRKLLLKKIETKEKCLRPKQQITKGIG